MKITQEEIEGYAGQFVRRALRYEGDVDFGLVDKATVFDQTRETVLTALFSDPNVIYHLLGVGAREEVLRIQEFVDIINHAIALLPSLTRHAPDDPVMSDDLDAVNRALVFAELSRGVAAQQRLSTAVDNVSRKLGRVLMLSDEVAVTTETARELVSADILSLGERYDLIKEGLEALVAAQDAYTQGLSTADLRLRVARATRSLIDDMRFERLDPDQFVSQTTARQRLIELQAARTASQILVSPQPPEELRISSGTVPEGTDVRLYPYGDAEELIASESSNSGGFNIQDGDTLQVSVDQNTLGTVTFPITTEPNLLGHAVPQPPVADAALYVIVRLLNTTAPVPVRILPPAIYHAHGYLYVPSLSLDTSRAVGCMCSLRYTGDRQALSTANKEAVEANEAQSYRVVGYDGRTGVNYPRIKLDPPFPTGRFVPASIQNEWSVTIMPPLARWFVPTGPGAYPTYLARLQAELAGPTDPLKVDAYQPWRVHTKITGTWATPGTYFIPGERVHDLLGAKQGIVVYHDASALYLLAMANPFVVGDTIIGYESGAQYNPLLTITTVGIAEDDNNAGQCNQARYLTTITHPTVLHLRARTTLGGGTNATLSDGFGGVGNQLVLTLAGSERGLWQLGLYNGDWIKVGGTDYRLDVITSNTTATIQTTGLHLNVVWQAPTPFIVEQLLAAVAGLKNDSAVFTITGQPGFDTAQLYLDWNLPRYRLEEHPAPTLELNLPQSDNRAWLSVDEVVWAINNANIPGLTAEEVRTTLYRHPDSPAPATTAVMSTQIGVPASLPSDPIAPNLTGYFLVPEDGPHEGLDFLIIGELAGPRRLVVDIPALVTETIPAYRIEARKVRLSTATRSTSGRVNFGSGLAHAKLGLPVASSVYGQFRSVRFTDRAESVDYAVADRGVVVGDVIRFMDSTRGVRTIQTLEGPVASLGSSVDGDLMNAPFVIAGQNPTLWDLTSRTLARVLTNWNKLIPSPMELLLAAFTPVATTNRQMQVGDVSTLNDRLVQLRSFMSEAQTALSTAPNIDIPAGRQVLEAVDENQLDRMRYALVHGQFDQIVESTYDIATQVGMVEARIRDVSRSLGTSSTASQIEDAERPAAVINGVSLDDYGQGYLESQYKDSDDDGEEL